MFIKFTSLLTNTSFHEVPPSLSPSLSHTPTLRKKDSFFVKAEPEAAKLKRKATVHFSDEEELVKAQKGVTVAPEKDTSVIFEPVRTATVTLKIYIAYLHMLFNFLP